MPDEAVNHLKIADNYLTHIADEIPDHPEVAKIQFLHTVEIATRHIQAARKLDLTAVYNHIDPKTKEVFPQSVEDMECRALFWEGYPTVEWSDNAYDIKEGVQALLKALNYGPYNAQVNKALGRAYLRLGDRVTADKYLKDVENKT